MHTRGKYSFETLDKRVSSKPPDGYNHLNSRQDVRSGVKWKQR